MTPFCKDILTVEKISTAFKNTNQELSDSIISCFYKCYKQLFTKWSIITYNSYSANYIEEIANHAFTDSVLKFKDFVEQKIIYERATIKTILFQFFRNTLRQALQNEKRFQQKQKTINSNFSNNLINTSYDEKVEKMHSLVEQAILKMKEEDRKIIIWRHLENKSNEEIADLLSITVESATNRIYRCMQRLKQIVQSLNSNYELN